MMSETPLNTAPYKDKKTGLLVFGIFEILLGAFFVLLLLVTVLGQLALAHRPEMADTVDRRSLWPTAIMMGGLAGVFIWLGIGSIKYRRWARALSLCLGWLGLMVGVISCVALVWTLPGIDAAMRQTSQRQGREMPAAILMITKIVMVVFTFLFYVVIPGALVLFYRSRHVKMTCEALDPVSRWTDHCPLPVLAMVLLQAFGAVSMLTMLPVYGRAFPFFGVILKGLPATAMYLLFAAFSIYAARGFYRLQLKAFWAYFMVVVIFAISGVITLSHGNLMALYQAIDLPKAQLQQIDQMPFMHSQSLMWMGATGGLLYAGFLFWLKRYFMPAEAK